MDNWTTVISFVYPHEAYIAKGKLESEGIETIIQDELTAQTNNFYSNAIGGVKLLVKESDFRKAYDILIESKWIIEKKVFLYDFEYSNMDKLRKNISMRISFKGLKLWR